MGIKTIWGRTKLGSYGSAFREAPREILYNKMLLLTCLLFACGAVPLSKSLLAHLSVPLSSPS